MVSRLRPNFSKYEIAGIGLLRDAKMALCALKSLDITKESIKILGVHISDNKKLQDDINFCMIVKNICNMIKLWCMTHLSLEGRIMIFKSLALSIYIYIYIDVRFSLFTSRDRSVSFPNCNQKREITNKKCSRQEF